MTTPRLRLVHDRLPGPEGDGPPEPHAPVSLDDQAAVVDLESLEGHQNAGEDDEARARRERREQLARQVVVALVAFQALAMLHDAPRDLAFAQAGAVAPPAWLGWPACAALYAATALLGLGRARGGSRTAFIVAAACFALSVPFWGLASPASSPFELGGTLALAGAWLVHRQRRVDTPLP